MVHMAVFDNDGRNFQVHGFPDDAVIILSAAPKSRLDSPDKQSFFPHVCQKLISELVPIAVERGQGRNPDFGTEQFMIFGGIVMDTEQKIGFH